MSRVISFLLITSMVMSCKPEIKDLAGSSTVFCNCSNASLSYKLVHTRNSTIVFTPAEAVTGFNQRLGMNDFTSATFRICQTAVATITATNDHGTAVKTFNFRRVTEPVRVLGVLKPLCTEIRFDGWHYDPGTDPVQLPLIPGDAVISTVVISVDRPGELRYLDRVVTLNIGTNTLSEFDNMRLFQSDFSFTAQLNPDEECAESGRELPSGRRPPPNFQITINTRCP